MCNNIKILQLIFLKEMYRVENFGAKLLSILFFIQYFVVQMRVCAVKNSDKILLGKIKDVLMTKWVNSKVTPQQISKKIDQKINKQGSEFIYGILMNEKDEILIVAVLFLQYKLTRGLSQIYHLQIEYKSCNEAQELYFQSRIVHLLPGYKITGLHVTKSQYFPPHQVYMETEFEKTKKVIGSL